MIFAFLQMLQWLALMLAVVLMALVFKKLNVSEKKAKILKPIIVIFVLLFFFVPFDEIITFPTPEKAFSGTVLGDALASAEGEKTCGTFYRDPRGTYSTVFFREKNGRYKKCASEARETVFSTEKDGIYVDIYRIAETGDEYIIVRGFVEDLGVYDNLSTDFEALTVSTSEGVLLFSMQSIAYDDTYELYIGEARVTP